MKELCLSSYVIRVCMWRIVQNCCLGEIPAQDAEIFDVVTEDAGAVLLIQTVPGHRHEDRGTSVS